MSYALNKSGIPGAVVVVVKDGRVIAEQGFGLADVAKGAPVDPAKTLFRPGSVSKLITWTALMQQVQLGRVALGSDVNRYLDFKIPPYRGEPVAVADLLAHTAGFEETVKDVITTRREDVKPFEQLLKQAVPRRIFAPGTTPAYSNYGASLAGYIVQRTSGEPFEAYVERHIFNPLAMTRSTFRQPLPDRLSLSMAQGYVHERKHAFGFEYLGPSPAGSMSTTSADMAKFMIAHLEGGGPILDEATARKMHSRLREPIPGMGGMAHGFYEDSINGHRVLGHSGDTVAFHSDLRLFIDDGVGLFVSLNGGGAQGASGHLRRAFFEEFADRYFPGVRTDKPLPLARAKANGALVTGNWGVTRGGSGVLSLVGLLGQISIQMDEQGRLVIPPFVDGSGQPRKWVAVGPMLWRDEAGHQLAGARIEHGKAVFFSNSPAVGFTREPWYRSAEWIVPLLALSILALTLTALLWPLRAIIRRHFSTSLPFGATQLRAFRASRIAAASVVAVAGCWAAFFAAITADPSVASASSDAVVRLLQIASIIVFPGAAAAMAWYTFTAWRTGMRWPAKVWSGVLFVATLAFLYVALVFSLISWSTSY